MSATTISAEAGRSREERVASLERVWRSPTGFPGRLMPVNHRVIGIRFVVTAFVFLALGGVLALLMRLQLAAPESGWIGPDLYNQIFTMHGTTMMFLFAVPVMEGLGAYVVPLMLGTRDMAFPRLNAFGYYVYAIGGAGLWIAFLLNFGPDAGWFSYVPLAGKDFSPGLRLDFWLLAVTFVEISALAAAIDLIVTILKQRAPGMSLGRMPLFVWAMLVTSFMIVFAMPAVIVGSLFLELDRAVGTHFYVPSQGGQPLLWQHLFWFFGHPEVYIIFIPALGIVSSIVVAFSRRPVIGYVPLVLSLLATGFLGFGLWVHHMYATGLPRLGASFFTAASLMIAIPSGVQIFCWIATLATGTVRLASPLLFVLGFFAIFVAGGLSGVMVASVPFDLQVHDTFFVVAHFHYVLIGGAVFPLLGGIHYWFPKISGRMLSERLARWSFALLFVGFNATFFPMHALGLDGMPRRVYTYAADLGWADGNLVASAGALVLAAGFALVLANALASLGRGERASDDPWGADTLEWDASSPPEPYNFADLPVVRGRYALWEPGARAARVGGIDVTVREVLVTAPLDAHPDHKMILPGPSIWPFLTAVALAIAFFGAAFSLWAVVAGGALALGAVVGWLWPTADRPPYWSRRSER